MEMLHFGLLLVLLPLIVAYRRSLEVYIGVKIGYPDVLSHSSCNILDPNVEKPE